MTLEEAEGRVDAILMEATASGEEHPPAKRDAEALRVVLAVARAFPKMLEALEASPHSAACHLMECDGTGCSLLPEQACDCGRDAALRAAREAVKP